MLTPIHVFTRVAIRKCGHPGADEYMKQELWEYKKRGDNKLP
jgi:hypothetical protein